MLFPWTLPPISWANPSISFAGKNFYSAMASLHKVDESKTGLVFWSIYGTTTISSLGSMWDCAYLLDRFCTVAKKGSFYPFTCPDELPIVQCTHMMPWQKQGYRPFIGTRSTERI